jgi:pyruvate-ferredoxin/flavodoxin oxidoreductase
VQTVKAFLEAESYDGPSLIIAYSHCIAHGYDMANGAEQQKLAVDSGYWPLFRYDPRRLAAGEAPLQLDSPGPRLPLVNYLRNEARFRIVEQQNPERYKALVGEAQAQVRSRYDFYENFAKFTTPVAKTSGNSNGNGGVKETAPPANTEKTGAAAGAAS